MKIKNYDSNTINVLSYFLILIPIFLISGPFLSDLAISILAIASIFYLKNKKYFNNLYVLFFLIFWILIILSSLFSENILLSIKSSSLYFRFFLFSLFVWWMLEKNKKILKKIYFILFFCFCLLIFDSLFQYFNGANIFNMQPVVKDRISSFFGEELKMGGFLMRLFPLLVALNFYFYRKNNKKQNFYFSTIFLILLEITVFLSGERTSFILFNFSILLFLFFLNNFLKIKIFIFFILFIVVSSLLTVDGPFKRRIVDLTIKNTKLVETGEKKYIFSKQYHEHYLSAWEMFKDNMIFGIGPKNFREKCKENKYNFSKLTCSTHPHNTPLQLLAETGIFGFLIYLTINLVIWYNLIKSFLLKIIYKKIYFSNFQISLLISIAILIWPLAPNGNFFNNWLSIILFYPVGFLLWEFRKSKKMQLKAIKKNTFLSKFYFTK